MSKRKTIFIVAGALVAVGAVAAISAPGDRGFRGGDAMTFGGWDGDRFMDGGRRGWWRQPMTQDEFDATTRARFARLDKNSDGVIDASEIEAVLTKRFEHHGKHGRRFGQRLMHAFDTDRDGKVTRDEFTSTVRSRFAQMDLNNDGRITDDDLPPRLRGRDILARDSGMGFGPGRRILRLLRDADTNKDGVVTLDEAMTAADKHFASLDRNKDGVLDTADRDALRTETVDYRVKRFIHYFGADADGKVTKEQFAAKAKERFARMDLNNDGTISRDERPGWRRGHHGERRGWFGRGGRDHEDRNDAPETKPGDSQQPK
ncbi:MAG: EF-hand domain-containing protein [Hyphomicrobiaceae bacterium]